MSEPNWKAFALERDQLRRDYENGLISPDDLAALEAAINVEIEEILAEGTSETPET